MKKYFDSYGNHLWISNTFRADNKWVVQRGDIRCHSRMVPPCKTFAQCQKNLDAYALKHHLKEIKPCSQCNREVVLVEGTDMCHACRTDQRTLVN